MNVSPELIENCKKLKKLMTEPMGFGEIQKLLNISYGETQSLILYASLHDSLAENDDKKNKVKYFFI